MNKLEEVGLFNGKYKGWMESYSGDRLNPLSIKYSDIRLSDIAHALSLICRYGGHCRTFYSVADHSIRVARLLEGSRYELAALLHDAAEAYLGDVIRPLKYCFPDIVKAERVALDIIYKRYNVTITPEGMDNIRKADNVVGATEARDLMASGGAEWGNLPEPLEDKLIPYLSPVWVEEKFMKMFREYGGVE